MASQKPASNRITDASALGSLTRPRFDSTSAIGMCTFYSVNSSMFSTNLQPGLRPHLALFLASSHTHLDSMIGCASTSYHAHRRSSTTANPPPTESSAPSSSRRARSSKRSSRPRPRPASPRSKRGKGKDRSAPTHHSPHSSRPPFLTCTLCCTPHTTTPHHPPQVTCLRVAS